MSDSSSSYSEDVEDHFESDLSSSSSDEDGEVELSGWEKLMSSGKQKMFFKFLEMLSCNEEPTYFDSVAEARALVKRHFPGKLFWQNVI